MTKQPMIRQRSFVRGKLWIPRQMPNKHSKIAPIAAAAAAASGGLMTPFTSNEHKTHKKNTNVVPLGKEQEESASSSRLPVVVTSARKAREIVGWDDILCRPIYASSFSSSSSSSLSTGATARTSGSSSPLMQLTSGSSSDDDGDEEETDHDFGQEGFSLVNKSEAQTHALATTSRSTTLDLRERRMARRPQRTFGIRRKRTLEEIELLEKLNDHDNDSSHNMALVVQGKNSIMNVLDKKRVEAVVDQPLQPIKESDPVKSISTTTVPFFHRRKHKKAKTATLLSVPSLSTHEINNKHGSPSRNRTDSSSLGVFDFQQDDDDMTLKTGDKPKKSPKATLKQPSARTSMGSARAFFEHLDRHCPIRLQVVDETNANNVSIAPGGGGEQVKNANGRTRRLVSLRDASVAKAYQAYRHACRDTGVPSLSLSEFWKQRRMAIGRHGPGDSGGAAEALYDGFLDEVFE